MNRRTFIAMMAAAAVSPAAVAQSVDLSLSDRSQMAAVVQAFMTQYQVPGVSIAIARQGHIGYAEAFGFADVASKTALTPRHRLRIASCSKPVTSVTIMRLMELGRLKLSDRVFGPGALLGDDYGSGSYRPWVTDITVEHLLTHTSGGWPNDAGDPMFTQPGYDHKQLITYTIANVPMTSPPGTHYAYANFGFCLLGRVIEKLTQQSYADAVQRLVLDPCGVSGMQIARNSMAQRLPDEVIYYGQGGQNPYGFNIARMDSHGGWVATPMELVRFLLHVDGFPSVPDILQPETIRIMTTPSRAGPNYAKGWAVNSRNNWWHLGELAGNMSAIVRTSSEFCWAILTNTRRPNSDMGAAVDALVWKMLSRTSWRA